MMKPIHNFFLNYFTIYFTYDVFGTPFATYKTVNMQKIYVIPTITK